MMDTAINSDKRVEWRFRNKHEDLGKFGERLWSRILGDCGMYYIPLSSLPPLNNKGPRLQGNDAILPDFEITANGKVRRCYMDSKCKTAAVLYKNANELRHGIDRKDWDSYVEISELQRQRCALGLVELFDGAIDEWLGAILIQTLGKLGQPIFGFNNQSHMVYWSRAKFFPIARTMPALEMWEIAYDRRGVSEEVRQNVHKFFGDSGPPIQGRMF